jgi:hypothetical protein
MTSPIDNRSPISSRRALLAGALGGLGALAAQALGRPTATRAEGQTMVVGGEYLDATSRTYIQNLTTDADVLVGYSGGNGYGVYGGSSSNTGVYGVSSSWFGVQGLSGSHTAVYGQSTSNIGVYGFSYAANQPATFGWSYNGATGVQGVSGTSLPAAKPKTGVYGYANQDSSSKGIYGESPAGYAGYFAGKVYTTRFHEMQEISAPAAPNANRARVFVRVNGSGKTQLCARFNTGAIQVIATQP